VEQPGVSRRDVLRGAGAGAAGLTVVSVAGPAQAFPGGSEDAVVLPWLDQPEPVPEPARDVVGNLLVWESLRSRLTPNGEFFTVKHYEQPDIRAGDYRLQLAGMVSNPRTLTLAELQALPKRTVDVTMECSGNHGLPFLIGAIGTARWGGTPLRRVLRGALPRARASEVVFWGADSGQVTLRDNPGVTGPGRTGTVAPDDTGGLDLTVTEQFARSMSVEEALDGDNLLCYEMNGEPLPAEHGGPLRLIAPGWYGVANVKWLTRIEVQDQRFAGRFMARDYVTVRERGRGEAPVWTFETVKHDRLKSAPARVTRSHGRYTITGVAWGAPVAQVDVSIDGGPWQQARLSRDLRSNTHGFAWRFWTLPWSPRSGVHAVRSRAVAENGHVQPGPEHPSVAGRRTYWEDNGQITRRVRIP